MTAQQPADAAPRTPFLRIHRLHKTFGDFVALDEVSLEVYEGELVCFLGPSGCGKTTFLRAIAGLDIQTAGQVEQAGRDISALPPSQRDFGIVFQSYALFPNLTVARNIAFGLENQRLAKADVARRVAELLTLVNLSEHGTKYPAQLSGGEQQRVALARALAISPGLLLLDEPLSALDAKVRAHLRHEMKALQRRLGVTTIMVTHDQEEALSMADRIVVMNRGVIEQVGTPTQIYRQPDTLFVADFIGAMNQVPGRTAGPQQVALAGGMRVAARPHGMPDGEAVVATIRPEDIVPHKLGEAPDMANAFDAVVEGMEFLGSFWRVKLRGDALGEATLTADISINAARRMGMDLGATLSVELPPARVGAFPQPERVAPT